MIHIGDIPETRSSRGMQRWHVDVIGDEISLYYAEETAAGIYGQPFLMRADTSARLRELLEHAEVAARRDHRQLELVA